MSNFITTDFEKPFLLPMAESALNNVRAVLLKQAGLTNIDTRMTLARNAMIKIAQKLLRILRQRPKPAIRKLRSSKQR
jgi:hypothetical protein